MARGSDRARKVTRTMAIADIRKAGGMALDVRGGTERWPVVELKKLVRSMLNSIRLSMFMFSLA